MKILRPEIVIRGCGGLNDAFDDAFKAMYNITDSEYDEICETATDDELKSLILKENATFTEKRAALIIRNKMVPYFKTK